MASDEAPENLFNVSYIEFPETSGISTTSKLSGSLFVSGGALIYTSDVGTTTTLGAY